MTFTQGDIAQLRGILYMASESQAITKPEHDLINNALLSDPNTLKANAVAFAAAGKLVKRYPSPLTDRLLELTKTNEPAPSVPSTPVPDSGITLTDSEISALRDINYVARKEYKLDGTPAWDRFIAMSQALLAGTYKQWVDSDRSLLLSMMAATSAGLYGPNRKMIDRFAAAIGVKIVAVPAPTGEMPPPAPSPANPQEPAVVEYGLWDNRKQPLRSFQSGPDFAAEVLEVIQHNTVRFDEHVGFGMDPIQNTEARITLAEGQILGISKSNFQNDDEQMLPPGVVPKHANTLDICNSDGGARILQYAWWYMAKLVRNTLNRRYSVRAIFDSQGESCWSAEPGPPGQMYYERIDHARKEIHLAAFNPGWKIILKGSSQYGACDIDLVEQAVRKVLAEKGL